MFKLITGHFNQYGFMATIKQVLNSILLRMGLQISRIKYDRKKSQLAKQIFQGRKLKYAEDGYWYIEPMPTEGELAKYYENSYWDNRGGKSFGSKSRDFIHWQMIKDILGNYFDTKKSILNFGAGHGGISYIFWSTGHNVINIEPSDLPKSFEERWTTHKEIKSVSSNSIDFVYGSHSLEHVQDINCFLTEVKRVLKNGGYVFWEIPNGDHPYNGPTNQTVYIPHTYYFQNKFFDKEFVRTLFNSNFDSFEDIGEFSKWRDYQNEKGIVIRVLGSYS